MIRIENVDVKLKKVDDYLINLMRNRSETDNFKIELPFEIVLDDNVLDLKKINEVEKNLAKIGVNEKYEVLKKYFKSPDSYLKLLFKSFQGKGHIIINTSIIHKNSEYYISVAIASKIEEVIYSVKTTKEFYPDALFYLKSYTFKLYNLTELINVYQTILEEFKICGELILLALMGLLIIKVVPIELIEVYDPTAKSPYSLIIFSLYPKVTGMIIQRLLEAPEELKQEIIDTIYNENIILIPITNEKNLIEVKQFLLV